MKTVPIEGTFSSVSFYEDDTIGRVRELIAIERNSHPDRLFLQCLVELPEGYYETPKEWTDLFFRLSRDGRTVGEDALKTYTTQSRPDLSGTPVRSYTKEQWETDDRLKPLRAGGQEWQILGATAQAILPLPPRDLSIPTNMIPLLRVQSLLETIHPYPILSIRVTDLPADPSDAVLRNYFPRLAPDTPTNLDSVKASILKSHEDFGKLLALPVKRHETETIVKAKWYIPLNATEISAPRTQFEQMFYGLTLSEETPYVAYFTSSTEALRSKFYVEDPARKDPFVNTSHLRGWYDTTRPQRRRPTLLLYEGKERFVFKRIAITNTDITIDIRKQKGSTKTLDQLLEEGRSWLLSLDSVMPFLDVRDLDPSRWSLSELSLLATYSSEETEFDMLRFPCLQPIFGVQDGTFRVLRAETTAESIPPQVLQAYQILNQEGAIQSPDYLAEELDISAEEASALLTQITALSEDINFERSLRSYPTLKFTGKEVLVRFATNPERILAYADILRYVLTTDNDAVNQVCPRRKETVAPMVSVPQTGLQPSEEVDEELLALLGVTEEPPAPPPVVEAPKKGRKLKVAEEQVTTQNYFNSRLKKVNPDLFDASYSKECEKSQQVVVLTPEDKARLGPTYNYESAPETEQLEIPGGTAICPPYWCMRDELPLREDQLVKGEDGTLQCPVCRGKVRPNDKVSLREYSVIKRETSKGRFTPYPGYMKNREGVPCCYLKPSGKAVTRNLRPDEIYVLNEDAKDLPPYRVARLPLDLAERLGVQPRYDSTIAKGRLEFGEFDIFRIGLGRPAETLPRLLCVLDKPIPAPGDVPDLVKKCSFYSTWRSGDPIGDIDKAFREKTLDVFHEVEYVSHILDFATILVDTDSLQVLCGFRTDLLRANNRTIVLLDRDVLGTMLRRRLQTEKGFTTEYTVDITQSIKPLNCDGKMSEKELQVHRRTFPPLQTTMTSLLQAHTVACSIGLPTITDAQIAFADASLVRDATVEDPFGKTQAFLLTGRVMLPFVPTTQEAPGLPTSRTLTYADLKDTSLLPTYGEQVAFLKGLKRQDLFGYVRDHRNAAGEVVEVELITGFRIPVREGGLSPGPVSEVTQTVAAKGEEMLVRGSPNLEGRILKDKIDYESELYEFLLFSLAKDIQPSTDGDVLDPTHRAMRAAIVAKKGVKKALTDWYAKEAYEEKTKTPYRFLSKVRTPCGQLKNEETCSKSSLCGWQGGDCKVQVRTSQVSRDSLLTRLERTLTTNEKQRALVLDNRVSPFFSTVLYLEMPNEWITTSY